MIYPELERNWAELHMVYEQSRQVWRIAYIKFLTTLTKVFVASKIESLKSSRQSSWDNFIVVSMGV
jgi:hypothetical protein